MRCLAVTLVLLAVHPPGLLADEGQPDLWIECQRRRDMALVHPGTGKVRDVRKLAVPSVPSKRFMTALSGARYSPNGKLLVFSGLYPKGHGVCVGGPTGADARLVISSTTAKQPCWAADGKRIFFTRRWKKHHQVWRVDADGRNPTRVSREDGDAHLPAASPAGKLLAYVEVHDSFVHLILHDLKTNKRRPIVRERDIRVLAWDPTGTHIAYGIRDKLVVRNVKTEGKAATFTLKTLDPKLTKHYPEALVWRPDGQAIACTMAYYGAVDSSFLPYGYNSLFVIPLSRKARGVALDGKATSVKLKQPVHPMRWRKP